MSLREEMSKQKEENKKFQELPVGTYPVLLEECKLDTTGKYGPYVGMMFRTVNNRKLFVNLQEIKDKTNPRKSIYITLSQCEAEDGVDALLVEPTDEAGKTLALLEACHKYFTNLVGHYFTVKVTMSKDGTKQFKNLVGTADAVDYENFEMPEADEDDVASPAAKSFDDDDDIPTFA